MIRINVSKMEDVHRWIATLPPGTELMARDVTKRFNLGSAAAGGKFISSSDRDKEKLGKGHYRII